MLIVICISRLFKFAQNQKKSTIILLDECHAFLSTPYRQHDRCEDGVMQSFLTEMNQLNKMKNVYVIGTTYLPGSLDKGQKISNGNYGVFNSPKSKQKNFPNFCPMSSSCYIRCVEIVVKLGIFVVF